MLRSILSVVVGVIVGSILILMVELIGHSMFPPPEGLDLADPDAIAKIPFSAKLSVVIAWFAGAFGGGVVASIIARRWAPSAWVVAATILLLAGITMMQFPHPIWMVLGAIAATGLGGFLAVKSTKGYYGKPFAGGPKPGL